MNLLSKLRQAAPLFARETADKPRSASTRSIRSSDKAA